MMREIAESARIWGPVVLAGETIRKSRKTGSLSMASKSMPRLT